MNSAIIIDRMRHQEETSYGYTHDYLYHHQEEEACRASCSTASSPGSIPLHIKPNFDVDAEGRRQMVVWCYQVFDFCKLNRETVEIVISYLDRYLCVNPDPLLDRKHFQKVCMTCLYTAVKVHEHEAISLNAMANLSQGTYTANEIAECEQELLAVLQWRMNPPTCLSFVREFLNMIPLSDEMKTIAFEITRFQTELTVTDYDFISVPALTIAYCSLMNSLESMNVPYDDLVYIGSLLADTIRIDCNNPEILLVQNCLYTAVLRQPNPDLIHALKAANGVMPQSAEAAAGAAAAQQQQQQQQINHTTTTTTATVQPPKVVTAPDNDSPRSIIAKHFHR